MVKVIHNDVMVRIVGPTSINGLKEVLDRVKENLDLSGRFLTIEIAVMTDIDWPFSHDAYFSDNRIIYEPPIKELDPFFGYGPKFSPTEEKDPTFQEPFTGSTAIDHQGEDN